MRDVPKDQHVVEEIESLARSTYRIRILEAIQEAGTIDRRALQDQFDMARTTLGRNLETLEDRGWIESPSLSTYSLTCAGEVVTETFSELMDVVQVTTRFRPFLKWVSKEAFDVDLRLLTDAELVQSTEYDPMAPVHRHVEVAKETDHGRMLLSVIGQQATQETGHHICSGDATFEMVIETGIDEIISTNAQYRELIHEQLATGRMEIFIYDGAVPYYLGILDDTVQVGVENNENVPRALIETDSAEVRQWAEQKYADYRHEARPFTVSDLQSDD